jgi:predicted ArsR family transcriptional regulator
MAYRSGLEIKKEIIALLKEKERVMSQLERKMDTSDKVLKRHIKELEYLGFVKITKHKRSPKTGRPFTTIGLTKRGREFLKGA